MTGPLIFLTAIALEFALGWWTLAVSKQKPISAAISSVLIVYGGTFLIQTWMDDHSLVHWTAAGHGLGSYVLLRFMIWWDRGDSNEQD